MGDYALLYILFAPFAGAIALIFVSNRQPLLVRGIAAGAAGLSLCSPRSTCSTPTIRRRAAFNSSSDSNGRDSWAFRSTSGVDGIGTPLVLASSILLFAGIFVSWHIKDRTKEFYIWL